MPEAKLAREAEICYATVAMVTDFDCWHPDHDAVTVQDIIKVLTDNAARAKALVARLAEDFPREHEPCPIGSDRALDTALITAPEARDPALIAKLDAVAARKEGIEPKLGGTYVCMEGPQFSTYAESMTYKTLGYSVIGMTNMPEAKLAREAEICYATVAMVTDFDCWHPGHDAVTVQDIIKVLMENAARAQGLVARLARDFPREHEPCPVGSDRALDSALITQPEARDPELIKKLDAVAGRVLR
jgi:purine nucleoside phosphorylase